MIVDITWIKPQRATDAPYWNVECGGYFRGAILKDPTSKDGFIVARPTAISGCSQPVVLDSEGEALYEILSSLAVDLESAEECSEDWQAHLDRGNYNVSFSRDLSSLQRADVEEWRESDFSQRYREFFRWVEDQGAWLPQADFSQWYRESVADGDRWES